MMDMSTFEDVTRRYIEEKLRVSDGMPETTPEPAEVVPEIEDLAIEREGCGDVVVRDEPAPSEIQRFPAVFVFGPGQP